MQNKLGDFTSTPRMITISAMAVAIGLVSAFVALGLLRLIGLFTNLFFFGRWSSGAGLACRQPLGLVGGSGAGGGRARSSA